mgnify:CR=1 FL=1
MVLKAKELGLAMNSTSGIQMSTWGISASKSTPELRAASDHGK